jgi:hypothetical protein
MLLTGICRGVKLLGVPILLYLSFARGESFFFLQKKKDSPPPPSLQSRHGCQRLVAAEALKENKMVQLFSVQTV